MIRIFTPHSLVLREYIRHISLSEFEASHSDYVPVIPDSMTELVILLDGSYRRLIEGGETIIKASHFIGLKSKPGFVRSAPDVKTVSVRFKPGAIRFFTKINAQELVDEVIDPILIFGKRFMDLEEKAQEVNNILEFICVLELFLLSVLSGSEKTERTRQRILSAYKNPGDCSVEKLRDTGDSYKSLEREFKQNLGISPKAFLRILQFNFATYQMTRGIKSCHFTEIGYTCGYFDQSHFIRSFKNFSTVTPGEYVQAADDMMRRNQQVINDCFAPQNRLF